MQTSTTYDHSSQSRNASVPSTMAMHDVHTSMGESQGLATASASQPATRTDNTATASTDACAACNTQQRQQEQHQQSRAPHASPSWSSTCTTGSTGQQVAEHMLDSQEDVDASQEDFDADQEDFDAMMQEYEAAPASDYYYQQVSRNTRLSSAVFTCASLSTMMRDDYQVPSNSREATK
jgi:hypothetical protein